MASLEDITAVTVAVEICNNPQLKKEIFCAPDSDYDANKTSDEENRKKQWAEIVEKKAIIIAKNLRLSNHLQEKVIGLVLSIGMRILTWAVYHEKSIGFSRNYSFNFLDRSFFTVRGIINCKKAAEKLMSDPSLRIKQKYKLALLYSMNGHIPDLYKQITMRDKKEFYDFKNPSRIKQPCIVKFWSYYLENKVYKIRGGTDPNLYWLEMAVKSGIRASVEYCLEQTNLIRDEAALIYAAQEAVKTRATKSEDWIVFGDHRSSGRIDLWVPRDYYLDVMCLIISKMSGNQLIKFLKQDIKNDYGDKPCDNPMDSKVMDCFLDWPYQDYFMKIAKLMWDILPERSYAELLFYICMKIELEEGDFTYGEGKCYDYRKLLREFWNESPERNKRYVLRDNEITDENGEIDICDLGKTILFKLFKLKNFTYEDMINIQIILACATNNEKDDIISSDTGKNICIKLMKTRRWLICDEFVSICCVSKDKFENFKREFSFTKDALNICIDFIRNDDWKSFETFISWSTLPTEEINQFKKNIIFSKCDRDICAKLISYDKKLTSVDNVFICRRKSF